MQRPLNKVVHENQVCVSASIFEHGVELCDEENLLPGSSVEATSIIQQPTDIYSMVCGLASSSDINFSQSIDLQTSDYYVHIFIDDIAYRFFDRLPEGRFVDVQDPIVGEMLDRILRPLSRFRSIVSKAADSLSGLEIRRFALLLPIHRENSWTLLWIRFTNVKKFAWFFQVDSKPQSVSEIPYNLKCFTSLLISRLLDIKDDEGMLLQYSHMMPRLEDETFLSESILVSNIAAIIRGYQEYGYNVSPDQIPFESTRLTAGKLASLRGAYSLNSQNDDKAIEAEQPENLQSERSTASFQEDKSRNRVRKKRRGRKRGRGLKYGRSKTEEEVNVTREEKNDLKKVVDTTDSYVDTHFPPYVVLSNLEQIRRQLPYDSEKLKVLTTEFRNAYNNIQRRFYSKWAGHATAEENAAEEDSFVFPMYGPTQIEYEILKEREAVATKSLLDKLTLLGISPTRQQMRSISNARRWINQRFKYDKQNDCVFYMRNPEVLIPDYRDIPYIILAVHLHYNCCDTSITYSIVRRNWYISRKCVSFIVSRCSKCHDDTNQGYLI